MILVHVILCALAIVGLYILLNDGPLGFVGKLLHPDGDDTPRFALADPLGACVYCMASLYGTLHLYLAGELPVPVTSLLIASALCVVCWVLIELLLDGTPAGKAASTVSVVLYLAVIGTVLYWHGGTDAIVFVLATSGLAAAIFSAMNTNE